MKIGSRVDWKEAVALSSPCRTLLSLRKKRLWGIISRHTMMDAMAFAIIPRTGQSMRNTRFPRNLVVRTLGLASATVVALLLHLQRVEEQSCGTEPWFSLGPSVTLLVNCHSGSELNIRIRLTCRWKHTGNSYVEEDSDEVWFLSVSLFGQFSASLAVLFQAFILHKRN